MSQALSILLAVVGIGLVRVVLLDALEAVVLPRRAVGRRRLAALFYIVTWRPWAALERRGRSERPREIFLWLLGPISVLVLLGLWAVGPIIGFALLRTATEGGQTGSLWHHFYASATAFFTLGIADVAIPLDRIVTIGEGGMEFSFLGLVIGYLPTFYGAFSRREVGISLLDARAGSPVLADRVFFPELM